MPALLPLLEEALAARLPWLGSLDETDAWRLFHGAVEGWPGLTIDRYGPLLLVQTFRAPLEAAELAIIESFASASLPGVAHLAWNHRGRREARVPPLTEAAAAEHHCLEHGLRFAIQARHRGRDPWLFLDFRSGRRRLRAEAAGRSVLNLFSYTCGAGVAAGVGGALEVVNVDFAASALEVGQRNAELNGLTAFETHQADVIPTLRQLAGFKVTGRGARKGYRRYEARTFDLVVLDPPTWATSRFGAVDLVRDYPALFKPAVLATAPGGAVLATNHVSTVDKEEWLEILRRCAAKAGRPLQDIEVIEPDPDFPSPDGRHPLKLAWCRV